MKQDQQIFTKVSFADEKTKIFEAMISRQSEIVCRTQEKKFFILKPSKYKSGIFYCEGVDHSLKDQENVLLSFTVGTERYFLKCLLRVYNETQISFSTTADLFQIQRRNNFRIPIPNNYGYFFNLTHRNQDRHRMKLIVEDLSAGGCQLRVENSEYIFEVNDEVRGDLNLGYRRGSLELGLIARHVRTDGNVQHIGFQIHPQQPQIEAKLLSIVLDIHRELFMKWSE